MEFGRGSQWLTANETSQYKERTAIGSRAVSVQKSPFNRLI